VELWLVGLVEGHEHEAFHLYIHPYKENKGAKEKILDKIFKENSLRDDDFKFIANSISSLLTTPFNVVSSWFGT